MTTYLSTASPPTPNGDLHVGHISGPFLAADVFNRYQRMQGNRSFYVTSTDDHQSFVVTTARRLGKDPVELAAASTEQIQATLEAADIRLDCYTSALGNQRHIELVQGLFQLLHECGAIVAKKRPTYECERCETFLVESYIQGLCPYCGVKASGNLCEACGRVYDPVMLVDPRCGGCGETPSLAEYDCLSLPLERYRAQLEDFYASRSTWRPHLRSLLDSLLENPLPDYALSYPGDWGIPVPIDGFEGQVINVWFEIFGGQIYTAMICGEEHGDPDLFDQLNKRKAKLVQFMGYDNSFFSGMLYVTVALALGPRVPLPEHVITNEFYFLDGEKFSTSQGHAIWASDLLAEFSADSLRYHVSRTNPEHWQTNFSMADFEQTISEELHGTWSESIAALLHAAQESKEIEVDSVDLQALGLIGWAQRRLERFYGLDSFSLRHASLVLLEYVEACGEYATRNLAQTGSPGTFNRLRSCATLLKALGVLSAPLMPTFAQRIWEALDNHDDVAGASWSDACMPHMGDVHPEGDDWFAARSTKTLMQS